MFREATGGQSQAAPEDVKERKREEKVLGAYLTTRPLEMYEQIMDFDPESFRSKTILDLGSGAEEEFAAGLRKRGIDANVISLNPLLGIEENKKLRERSRKGGVVAGIAQKLPLRPDSVDHIVALYSVPYYLPNIKEEYVLSFLEMDRVLRNEGTISLFPIVSEVHEEFAMKPERAPFSSKRFKEPLAEVLRDFQAKGYSFDWRRIKDDEEYKGKSIGRGWRLIMVKPKKPEYSIESAT